MGKVTSNATFGASSALTGTYHRPETSKVLSTATFGINSSQTGTVVQASAGDVEAGVTYGPSSTLTGTFVVPTEVQVESGVTFGNAAEFTGSLVGGGSDLDTVIDAADGYTVRQLWRLVKAVMGGKSANYGADYRNPADTKTVVNSTLNTDGNRTSVTLNLT